MQIAQQDVEAVIEVTRSAAELVRRMQRAGLNNVRSKSSEGDLVTEADVASERLIRETLSQRYPSVALWGEESNQAPTTEYFWLVDPIDGTNNYAVGLDYNAVTIALQKGEQTLLGVTYQIHTGRVYYARLGEGAVRRDANGEETYLCVNTVDRLGAALLATGFPYHRAESTDNNSAEFTYFLPRTTGLRCLGAAALDTAHVASGALAAFWEGWLNAWDAAAGALLVREAGGRVTNYLGDEWRIHDGSIIASNGRPGIHDALVDGIRSARATLNESRMKP